MFNIFFSIFVCAAASLFFAWDVFVPYVIAGSTHELYIYIYIYFIIINYIYIYIYIYICVCVSVHACVRVCVCFFN